MPHDGNHSGQDEPLAVSNRPAIGGLRKYQGVQISAQDAARPLWFGFKAAVQRVDHAYRHYLAAKVELKRKGQIVKMVLHHNGEFKLVDPEWKLTPAIGGGASSSSSSTPSSSTPAIDTWHEWEGEGPVCNDFLHPQLAVNTLAFNKATWNDLDFKNARSSMVVPAIGGHDHVRQCLIISLPQTLLAFEEHEVQEVYRLWCQLETVIQARRAHAANPKKAPKAN